MLCGKFEVVQNAFSTQGLVVSGKCERADQGHGWPCGLSKGLELNLVVIMETLKDFKQGIIIIGFVL